MTDLAKTAESEGLTHAEARAAIIAAARLKHEPPRPPAVMTMSEVAKALGRSTRWVRRKLIEAGVATRSRPGAHWEVTREDMRFTMRKYWVELEMDAARR